MANGASSKLGGVLGAAVGMLVIGGLVATPFFVPALRSDASQLDSALQDRIEEVRRLALHLDANLAALSDLYDSLGEEGKVDPAVIDALLEGSPREVSKRLRVEELTQSSQRLNRAEQADQQRGTKVAGRTIPFGRPNVRAVPETFRKEYLKAHDKLLAQAESAINALRRARAGDRTGANHLGANRVAAMLYLVKGRIEQHRAAFEHALIAQRCDEAAALAGSLAEFRRDESAMRAESPDSAAAGLEASIKRLDARLTPLRGIVAQLTEVIAEKERRIAALEVQAKQARRGLATLESAEEPIHGPDSPYLELSETARKAEAEAEALRNGTLAGATLAEAEAEDLLTAPYVDGQPAPGVRDLKVRLEQVKTQLAGYETARTTLLERKAHYEALAEQFGEAARKTGAGAEDLSTRIAKLMEQCTAQLPRAEKAADAALKSFSKAGQFAQAAIRAAAQRTREARSAAATAVGIEAERLRMITDDGDTEASVQELAAEAAYQAALTRAMQMHALQRRYGTERFVASLADRSEPESIEDRVEAYRKEAIERLASARKALEAAERLIAKSRARTDHGTVQGKDYVWQVKVGQAAVHLLEAALLDDTDAVFAKKDAAYRLLTEAAQGRERSPLLTPAIETLQYLQDSVR